MRRDLEEIYGFYVDEEHRTRLAKMRRVPRFFVLAWWLLKSLLGKLSPIRRTLLLISLICFYLGRFSFRGEGVQLSFDFYVPSILILLWIVMLELKDKLMVREEIEIGRAIQLELLPENNPVVPGWGVWLMSRPANEVGGDLADYLPLDGSRIGLSLGDVAGKGLGAAMLMAKLQATLRAIAPESRSLEHMGERINRIFCRDCGAGRFATLIYAEMAEGSGSLRILNAGHPPPIVVTTAGVRVLPAVALPIGVVPDAHYVEQHLELEPRDLVVFYSDGVSEASNRDGVFFGEDRLRDLVSTLRDVPAEQVGARIIAEVERFMGDAKPSDDLSLIVVQRL